MSKFKTAITWVLFALCLVISFTLGYYIRGIAEPPAQTDAAAKTAATVQTTALQTTALHFSSAHTATTSHTADTQTTTQAITPTAKPSQSTTAQTTTAQTTTAQTTTAQTTTAQTTVSPAVRTYILNTSSKKIHYPSCSSAKKIAEKNRKEYTGDYTELFSQGYTTCGICFK